MAGKTTAELTDLVGALQTEVATLKAELAATTSLVDRANLQDVRERLDVVERLTSELKRWEEENERRGPRLAVLESQLADMKKREEENDRRRWQFWLGVGVVVLTFTANLTIQLLTFFA